MNKFKAHLLVLFCLSFSYSASTLACMYVIDEAKKSAELKAVALASLGDVTVINSDVSNFKFFESKPTPMCPEEMTYTAEVAATFRRGTDACIVRLSVKKVEPWKNSDLDVYSITGRDSSEDCN